MIDLNSTLAPAKPRLQVCKPNINRSVAQNLTTAYSIERKLSLGNIGELSFRVPYEMDRKHTLVPNTELEFLKERFIIKFSENDTTEYYLITAIKDVMDDARDYKNIECFSLGYELSSKLIMNYNVVSKNATTVLVDLLIDTIWSVGYVGAQFDLKFRSIEIDRSTVLDAVMQVAETFDALIVWNTDRREISFYELDQIGADNSLKVAYGKLMKTVDSEQNTDEFCTRLRVFGKDGVSIQAVNPTGTNFIQSFNYFMYPFYRDEEGQIQSHSAYMSDDLCMAIEDYEQLIEENTTVFTGYLTASENLLDQLTVKNDELFILQTEFDLIDDQISVINANGNDPAAKIVEKNQKQVEIDDKQSEISSLHLQMDSVLSDIEALKLHLSMDRNFTPEQIIELNQFIIEKEFTSQYHDEPKELLESAKIEFDRIRSPKFVAKIAVVNFLQLVSEKHNHDKLKLGDTITVTHEKLGINIKAKIMEISINYEAYSIDLTISNVSELLTDEERFIRNLYKSVSTSTTVDANKYKWNEAKATADDVSQILNNTWDAVKRGIVAGANNEVSINRKGIRITDPSDALKVVILQHNQIALTSDGGNTWKTAVTPDGVFAERLIGKIIMGNQLSIQDDDGTFFIEGNLLTVKDTDDIVRLLLGEYEAGKFGLKLMSKDGSQVVLSEDGLLQSWQDSTADNLDPSNPLVLNVFIPASAISVRETRLRFRLLPFRSYSTGAMSGGGATQTSSNEAVLVETFQNTGGTDFWTDGSMYRFIPGLTGDYVQSHNHGVLTVPVQSAGSHDHGGSAGSHNHGNSSNNNYAPPISNHGNHTHVATVAVGAHTHNTYNHGHRITIPNHTHEVTLNAHQHTVNIPSHSHALIHGIFTSTTPQNVAVTINGFNRTAALGGGLGFNSDQNNLNITQYMQIGQWNTITLATSRLGRLDASIFNQVFMGV